MTAARIATGTHVVIVLVIIMITLPLGGYYIISSSVVASSTTSSECPSSTLTGSGVQDSVVDTIQLGHDASYVAVDSVTQILYVTDSSAPPSNTVTAIDT